MYSHHRVFEEQQKLVADHRRIAAFERAIAGAVGPASVVVELGTGVGILSMVSCRAGARRVYAIDADDVAELAAQAFRDNGVSERVMLLRTRFDRAVLPERADVLISNRLGNVGFDEQILSSFIDARSRFLKPGGALFPSRIQLVAAPVEAPAEHAKAVTFWSKDIYGTDHSVLQSYAARQLHLASLERDSVRSTPQPLIDVDLSVVTEPIVSGRVTFEISKHGEIHGLGGWFRAQVGSEWISNEPPNELPSCAHGFFPFEEPVSLEAGDSIDVQLATADGRSWQWEATCRSGGRLLRTFGSPQTSRTRESESNPGRATRQGRRLSRLGEAAHLVLRQLEQGKATTNELVAQLRATMPEAFPTDRSAQEFVFSLLQDYGVTPE